MRQKWFVAGLPHTIWILHGMSSDVINALTLLGAWSRSWFLS